MNEQSQRFQIGLFVVFALFALGLLIALFQIYPSVFAHNEYTVIFDKAAGVTKGTPVRRSGVRIGEVRDLELKDETGKVHVRVWIDKKHPLFKSDQPKVVHGFLSGDTSIDFLPPLPKNQPAQPEVVTPGDVLVGEALADMATLMEEGSRIVPPAQDALNEISKTLKRYEAMAPLVEETLKYYRDLGKAAQDALPDFQKLAKTANELAPELRDTLREIHVAARNWGRAGERADSWLRDDDGELRTTLRRLREAGDSFKEASQGVKEASGRIARLLDDANLRDARDTIQNVNKGSKHLETMAQNAEALLKDGRRIAAQLEESMAKVVKILDSVEKSSATLPEDSRAIIDNLKGGTAEINKLVAELREALRVLGTGDGTIRRFLSDPALYNSLNESVTQATRLIPRLERILKDVEVFTDKIARHPESLGIGGAVRPSSGLKEGPSHWMQPQHYPDR